jgi:hypothetical protein
LAEVKGPTKPRSMDMPASATRFPIGISAEPASPWSVANALLDGPTIPPNALPASAPTSRKATPTSPAALRTWRNAASARERAEVSMDGAVGARPATGPIVGGLMSPGPRAATWPRDLRSSAAPRANDPSDLADAADLAATPPLNLSREPAAVWSPDDHAETSAPSLSDTEAMVPTLGPPPGTMG